MTKTFEILLILKVFYGVIKNNYIDLFNLWIEVCVCEYDRVHVDVRRQLVRVIFHLLLCGFYGLNASGLISRAFTF